MQNCVCSFSPTQSLPALFGFGLMHLRILFLTPCVSHVPLHSRHGSQLAQAKINVNYLKLGFLLKHLHLMLWIKSDSSGNWELLSRSCNHGKEKTWFIDRKKKVDMIYFHKYFSNLWNLMKFSWAKPSWKAKSLNEQKKD